MNLITRLRAVWNRLFASRYTRLLERELARLRAENRALLNSILGIAGVPPLPLEAPPEDFAMAGTGGVPENRVRSDRSRDLSNGRAASTQSVSGPGVGGHGALPLRRRSWQQINRMLELESARKKAEA